MKAKFLSVFTKALRRTMLLFMTFVSLSVSAEWQSVELDKLYDEPNFKDEQTTFTFTPAENGVLTIWSQDAVMHVYTELAADGSGVDYQSITSSFAYASFTFDDIYFPKRTTSDVQAGKTYYIHGEGTSKGMKFLLSMQTGINTLELVNCNQPVGGMFNITDERDGQLALEFNLPATADGWASLQINEHKTDSIETRHDPNTGRLIFELKDTLYSWMQKGYYEVGDKMTFTVTGLCAQTNKDIKYGTDGTLVLEWNVPGKPHYLLSVAGAEPFKSYWVPGDEDGIVTLTFDYPLMTKENGQTATVQMLIGSADMGDVYAGILDSDKITVDGNKLIIDFTGVRRAYEDLGLKSKWTSISLRVFYILMEDGTSSFNENSGSYGSAEFSRSFVEVKSDIVAEFTPASGSQLTEKLFKVYFSEKDAYRFDGVELYFQTLDDEKRRVEILEGITSVEEGDNGIEYTIPVPDEVFEGKNIRVQFMNVISSDGFAHDFGVKYNPGPELTDDLTPVSSNVKNGDVVASLNDIRLTFEEEVHVVSSSFLPVYITDLTTQKQVPATMEVDAANSKVVVITPSEAFKECHQYEIMVNYGVIVNNEYVETDGKYGRCYIGEILNITISSLYNSYDFATNPIAGATVGVLDKIVAYTKPGANLSTELISPTLREDRFVWVENEAGEKVTDCTVNNDVQDGFSINLQTRITESGNYVVVLQDSVYNMGEGYTVNTNDHVIRIPYTVLQAPEASITLVASNPVAETTVNELDTITLEFSEWVYGDECTVDVFNKTTYANYSATLTINPKLRNTATITFDDGKIMDKGSYTVTIREASLGDQIWYESDGMTGKTNETINLYYTIAEQGIGDSDFFTTDPANNSHVESLSHIKITFNEDSGIGNGMIVVKKDGEQVARIDAQYDDDWDNVLDFHLYYDATEDGVYTFEVPEGYFLNAMGDGYPAFTLTYVIGEGQEISDYVTDPENNSTVASLHEIHVWNTTVSEMGGGSGKVVLKRDGVELEQIADASFGLDFNEMVITTSMPYTESGVYTLEVPEGFFLNESGDALPAVTFTWIVDTADSISAIATKGKTVIYTISGRQTTTLRRGINIVNGKKVLVK